MSYLDFITQALKKASAVANERFGKVSAVTKQEDNNQVLTETDLEIGKLLIEQIKNNFPSHNIIDEEAGVINNGSEYTWVVDPIDGTSNFACGLPNYGIMLGLLHNELSIAGGVAIPFFKELYIGEKGKGAFCNGRPIKVTGNNELRSTLVSYQLNGYADRPDFTRKECSDLAEIVLNIRNLRTTNCVWDIMMVADGKYGACLNQTCKIWDNVAQQVILEEAGGVYTDFWGAPIDYSNPLSKAGQNYTFCCAPAPLHKQLQKIIHR